MTLVETEPDLPAETVAGDQIGRGHSQFARWGLTSHDVLVLAAGALFCAGTVTFNSVAGPYAWPPCLAACHWEWCCWSVSGLESRPGCARRGGVRGVGVCRRAGIGSAVAFDRWSGRWQHRERCDLPRRLWLGAGPANVGSRACTRRPGSGGGSRVERSRRSVTNRPRHSDWFSGAGKWPRRRTGGQRGVVQRHLVWGRSVVFERHHFCRRVSARRVSLACLVFFALAIGLSGSRVSVASIVLVSFVVCWRARNGVRFEFRQLHCSA